MQTEVRRQIKLSYHLGSSCDGLGNHMRWDRHHTEDNELVMRLEVSVRSTQDSHYGIVEEQISELINHLIIVQTSRMVPRMKAVSIGTSPEQDKPAVTVKSVFNSEIGEQENFNQAYRQYYFAG